MRTIFLFFLFAMVTLTARGPDYLIVGAQKSGTTALFHLLQQHPQIAKQSGEIHYFDLHFDKGQEWYEKRFTPFQQEGLIAGDKSPYYLFHPLVAERVFQLYPKVKIFVVLRNPVDRSYSQYWFNRRGQREVLPTFEEAIQAEAQRIAGQKERFFEDPLYHSFKYMHCSYLARSRYVEQLKEWFKFFPRAQIMIVDAEDLRHHTVETLNEAFEFLALHPFKVSDKNAAHHSVYPKMEEGTRRQLSAYFKPYNTALETLLGRKFHWK